MKVFLIVYVCICMCIHTCAHDIAFIWLLENSVRWHSCCPPYMRQGFRVFPLCVSGQLGHKFSGNCLCLPTALRSSGIRGAHTVSEFWVLGISTQTHVLATSCFCTLSHCPSSHRIYFYHHFIRENTPALGPLIFCKNQQIMLRLNSSYNTSF